MKKRSLQTRYENRKNDHKKYEENNTKVGKIF